MLIQLNDKFGVIVHQRKYFRDYKTVNNIKHRPVIVADILNCFQDQVKTILDHQVQENDSLQNPTQKSDPSEPATPHYATREEVVMATMKELEKMKAATMETGKETAK